MSKQKLQSIINLLTSSLEDANNLDSTGIENPDNFTINFNLNRIKLLIVQDNNILFDDCIIRKIIDKTIPWRGKG